MRNIIKSVSMLMAALLISASPGIALTYSKTKGLAVVEPRELPEQAHIAGDALLLHSDGAGHTYLYVEQQQGHRLSVFNVTDPARIRLTVSTRLGEQGPFDFVRFLGDDAVLIYFRDTRKAGLLDLHQAKRPEFRVLSTSMEVAAAEPLGASGVLATTAGCMDLPAATGDVQIIDISSAHPTVLATVKDVKDRVTNDETGTTFLIGGEGLTVVRRLHVEYQHEANDLHMQGN